MSDRLAISAALSVLMMAIFVLFGTEADGLPFRSEDLSAPVELEVPGLPALPSAAISLPR